MNGIVRTVLDCGKSALVFADKHKEPLLIGTGVALLVATPILGILGGHQAERHIVQDDRAFEDIQKAFDNTVKKDPERPITFKDQAVYELVKLKHTWRFYMPSIISAAGAGLCFGAAYNFKCKENIKLASACVAAETLVTQYQDQFVEPRNAQERKRNREIDDEFMEIAEKNYDPSTRKDDQDCFVYDAVTGYSFWSSEHAIKSAFMQLREDLLLGTAYVSLGDLYMQFGEDRGYEFGEILDKFGWVQGYSLPEVTLTAEMRDGKPVGVIHYKPVYLDNVLYDYKIEKPKLVMTQVSEGDVPPFDPDNKEKE